MFLKKINIRNFFFRKKFFFDTLDSIFLAMRFCCNCTISNKIYCINNNFEKCVKCVQSSCNHNLTIFFISTKQIYKEQIYLKKEVRNTHTKLSRLEKQLNFLKNKKKKIIVTK